MPGAVEAKAVMRADNRRLGRDLNKTKGMYGRAFRGIAGKIKSSMSGAVAAMGAFAGGAALLSLGKQAHEQEGILLDIEVQSGATAETMEQLRATISRLSGEYAMSGTELSQATMGLVNLQGQAGMSAEKLEILARAAFATNSPIEEMGGLVFSLQNAFGLNKAEDLEAALASVVTAGKYASVPLNEMNLVLQQVSSQFKRFTDSGQIGAVEMASTLQVLRKSFGSSLQAGTGLSGLLGVLSLREIELGRAGIHVKDAAGNYRDLYDIVDDVESSGILKDTAKYLKAFGKKKEAREALLALIEHKEVLGEINEAAKKGSSFQEDINKRQASHVFRVNKSLNDMKERMLAIFTPERIEKFAGAMERIAGVLEHMIDNAGIYIALWAGMKLATTVSMFTQMGVAMGGLVASAGGFTAALGQAGLLLGKAGILGVVGVLTYKFGQMIDNWLGVSDAIADLAIGEKELEAEKTGFIRDQAKRVGVAAAEGGELDERERRSGRYLLRAAKEQGLISSTGKIDRTKVFATAEKMTTERAAMRMQMGQKSAAADELEAALKFAIEQSKSGGLVGARGQNVTIQVRVNPVSGQVLGEESEASKARRGGD